MKTTRITEITVETDEVVVVRKLRSSAVDWCAECGEATTVLTPEEAVALTGASWREISRRVEAGRVHFTETTDGLVVICIKSLSQ